MISKGIGRVSIGMGYNGIFGSLGVTIAPLLAGALNWGWGPRAVYIFLGALNFFGFIFVLMFQFQSKVVRDEEDSEEKNGNLKAFLILLAAMTLGGIVYRGATVILPAYVELKSTCFFSWLSSFFFRDFSRNLLATSTVSAIYFASMAGQRFGGRAGERFNLKVCYLSFHSVTVPAAIFMGFASDIPLAALSLVYFFFLLGMQPIENTLVAELVPKRLHHSAYGIKFVMTFGVGALAVKLVENIKESYSIESVFPALGFVSFLIVVIAAIFLFFDRPRKNGTAQDKL